MKKVLIVLLSCLLFSCNNTGSDKEGSKLNTDLINNPASATDSNSSVKEPKIEFQFMEHDFGNLMQGEKATYRYKFKNSGNAPLLITAVEKTCGCTSIKHPRTPINPGEGGEIEITYDSKGHRGIQNKRIIVKANTNPSETILHFKANVETVNDK